VCGQQRRVQVVGRVRVGFVLASTQHGSYRAWLTGANGLWLLMLLGWGH
jgi:hypothetical protein